MQASAGDRLSSNAFKNKVLFAFVAVCVLVTSCGPSRKVLPAVSINPIEQEIERHLSSSNIDALIADCIRYPEYADQIRNTILFKKNYSSAKYSDLLNYREKASGDPVLAQGFDAKVKAFENKVYQQVQDMPLSSLISYYKSNRDYQPFLRTVVREGLRKQISNMEYKELRATRTSLLGSDFEGLADSAYFAARKATESVLMRSVSSFTNEEKKAINNLQLYIDDTLTVYTAHAFQSVLRIIADTELPSNKSSIEALVRSSVDKNFSPDQFRDVANIFLVDYQHRVNKSRSDYYKQLTGEDIPSSALLDLKNVIPTVRVDNIGGLTPLYELSKIQNDVNLTGIGLTVAGALLSGGLSLLVSAASAVNSYYKGKDKAEKKKEYLSQFSKQCLPGFMKTKEQFFTLLQDNINAAVSNSQKAFSDLVYENY